MPWNLCDSKAFLDGCGGRIRTNDLRVMSPTSYQTALLRDISLCQLIYNTIHSVLCQPLKRHFPKKLFDTGIQKPTECICRLCIQQYFRARRRLL